MKIYNTLSLRKEEFVPLKFFDDMSRKIWKNLAIGRNMFVLYDKNMKTNYLLDSFENVLQKESFGKFNSQNTEINRFNDKVNVDFVVDEIKRGIKDKDKKHVAP